MKYKGDEWLLKGSVNFRLNYEIPYYENLDNKMFVISVYKMLFSTPYFGFEKSLSCSNLTLGLVRF